MGRVVVDVPWVMGVTLLSLQIASAGTVHSGLLRNSGSATVAPASPTESAQTLRGNNAANVLATRPADDPGAAACPRPASHGGTDLGRLGPMAVPALEGWPSSGVWGMAAGDRLGRRGSTGEGWTRLAEVSYVDPTTGPASLPPRAVQVPVGQPVAAFLITLVLALMWGRRAVGMRRSR